MTGVLGQGEWKSKAEGSFASLPYSSACHEPKLYEHRLPIQV